MLAWRQPFVILYAHPGIYPLKSIPKYVGISGVTCRKVVYVAHGGAALAREILGHALLKIISNYII